MMVYALYNWYYHCNTVIQHLYNPTCNDVACNSNNLDYYCQPNKECHYSCNNDSNNNNQIRTAGIGTTINCYNNSCNTMRIKTQSQNNGINNVIIM